MDTMRKNVVEKSCLSMLLYVRVLNGILGLLTLPARLVELTKLTISTGVLLKSYII